MTKSVQVLPCILLLCATILVAARSVPDSGCSKFKSSTIEFYIHDKFTEPNKTLLQVAGPGSLTSVAFGLLGVVDDPITEGQSNTSRALGRMRGSFTSVSLDGITFLFCMSAVLDTEKYNGTISLFGSARESDSDRFLPVVGGTGDFERASGIAHARALSSFDGLTSTIYYNLQITHL